MRFDIAFFLCCCRSFLKDRGRDDDESFSFYALLGVTPKAKADELKKAYKRQSLLMHPDKLAQKGQSVTGADRDRFTRMRHAYEVLSDPRRRETYDAIGERGMKWVEEPLSVDPQELAHNFATSSIVDRSKVFAIFLGIYVAVFVLPILVCLMIDGSLGRGVKWVAVLTPLWVWDAAILFYHSRVILMGPIKRPDHVPEEEWVDPLPMWKRVTAMVRFACLVLFQVLLALRLDGYIIVPYSIVFIPLYLWEAIALRRKIVIAHICIVTHEELLSAIGKKIGDCSAAEREDVHRRFIVVPSKTGNGYEMACRLRDEARMDIIRIMARLTFVVLLVFNLDRGLDWSWWLVFLPIFAMVACIVGSAFGTFSKTRAEAAKKDPSMFGMDANKADNDEEQGKYAKMDENKQGEEPSSLRDEEKDELKAKVATLAYRTMGTCFSQCFFILIMCILIGKIEGASYSSLLIISPFLAAGGVVLCCLACTIFCISEVDENAGMAEFDTAVDQAAAASGYGATDNAQATDSKYIPPSQEDKLSGVSGAGTSDSDAVTSATNSSSKSKSLPPPSSAWDPEKGETWQNTADNEGEKRDGTTTKDTETPAVSSRPSTIEAKPSCSSVTSSQCDLD